MSLRGGQLSSCACLPKEESAFYGAQYEYRVIAGQSDAGDAFRERDRGLLIAFLPVVYMDDRLVCLRSENVILANGQAFRCCGAFLEDCSLLGEWLEFVDEDGCIFRHARRRRLLWHAYRGDEPFRQHHTRLRNGPGCMNICRLLCEFSLSASAAFPRLRPLSRSTSRLSSQNTPANI